MNITLIASLVTAAAGFGLAWQLQAHQIVKLELDHANTRIAAAAVARSTIERTTTNVITAQNAATVRAGVHHRDAAASRGELDGLRASTDAAMRAAATDLAACNTNALALGVIQSQCTGQLQALASTCDGHASDVRLLQEAWPH